MTPWWRYKFLSRAIPIQLANRALSLSQVYTCWLKESVDKEVWNSVVLLPCLPIFLVIHCFYSIKYNTSQKSLSFTYFTFKSSHVIFPLNQPGFLAIVPPSLIEWAGIIPPTNHNTLEAWPTLKVRQKVLPLSATQSWMIQLHHPPTVTT